MHCGDETEAQKMARTTEKPKFMNLRENCGGRKALRNHGCNLTKKAKAKEQELKSKRAARKIGRAGFFSFASALGR